MPKGKRIGGRQKGTPNKATEVRQHFLDAWQKRGGPKAADRLLAAALERALGYDAVEKTYVYELDPQDAKKRVRVLAKEKVTREHDTSLLALCLPYFAQQMPRLSEITGAGGQPLVPPTPALPPLDMSKWTESQVDRFIAATAAVQAARAAAATVSAAAPAPAPAAPPTEP
ncbi:MAG: hypothetical protein PHS14_00335 [Elusimicrobia bacterium]|nr:hypothetical protein [Elusimicrobiota bacterium]